MPRDIFTRFSSSTIIFSCSSFRIKYLSRYLSAEAFLYIRQKRFPSSLWTNSLLGGENHLIFKVFPLSGHLHGHRFIGYNVFLSFPSTRGKVTLKICVSVVKCLFKSTAAKKRNRKKENLNFYLKTWLGATERARGKKPRRLCPINCRSLNLSAICTIEVVFFVLF